MEYITGTSTKVTRVERIRPKNTTAAIDASLSAPSPCPTIMGNIASTVTRAGHQDRPEPDGAGLVERIPSRQPLLPQLVGIIDQHDGVVGDDPDQHDRPMMELMLSVWRITSRPRAAPTKVAGRQNMMMNGVSQRLEQPGHDHVHQDDGERHHQPEGLEGLSHIQGLAAKRPEVAGGEGDLVKPGPKVVLHLPGAAPGTRRTAR